MIPERVTPKLLARGNEIGVINAAFKHGQVSHQLEAFESGEHIFSSNWQKVTED